MKLLTGDRKLSSHGYVKIRVGRGHPLADSKGYAYEHLVVWLAAGRPKPKASELLHHRNENKQDNRLQNLRLVTRSWHSKHHVQLQARRADGTFVRRKVA
jgi:HNH endonuclease